MQPKNEARNPMTSGEFTDAMIRVGLIAVTAVLCFRVFSPFIALMVWALILAITLYPLHQSIARRLGGKQGSAATLIVLIGVLLIGTPLVMLSESMTGQMQDLATAHKNQTLNIPAPAPDVAEWPVIGNKVYKLWHAAATNLPAFLKANKNTVETVVKRILAATLSSISGVFLFTGALIVAGIMMAWGRSGSAALQRIMCHIAGPEKGLELHKLSTLTVRSVAAGVIGVAFIQALILGVGFMFAGIPGAGILAVVVLLIGILQLPALIISVPVIAYMWVGGDASTMHNIVWTIYLLVGGTADNVLKPLLLGRGVDIPMPVILMGALGGMVSAGLIGLFGGAVLLAVGYQVFMDWVGPTEAELSQSEDDSSESSVHTS
ncbi:MAG: putative PurR-regulated permease PerM [Parasphingorhabdus sp.]|jgi:predicted PurR-regulated permease PerM